MTITVIVKPSGAATFEASVDDEVLGVSESPFVMAGRILAERGADPKTRIVMRHLGTDHDALISTVGTLARIAAERAGKLPVRAKRGGVGS